MNTFSTGTTSKTGPSTFKVVHLESANNDHLDSAPSLPSAVPTSSSVDSGISKERRENIESVKAILDYLGEGFINACLELYNDNVEIVCDRILSEDLAEPLLEIDRSMPLQISAVIGNTPAKFEYNPVKPTNFIPIPDEFSSFHIGKMYVFTNSFVFFI